MLFKLLILTVALVYDLVEANGNIRANHGTHNAANSMAGRHGAYVAAYTDWFTHICTNADGSAMKPEENIQIVGDSGVYPSSIFDSNLADMSTMFKKFNVTVNYVNIGACDGENDGTQVMYWKDNNMQGTFIEPLEANVKDFELKIDAAIGARSRTIMIRAAVNETCDKKFLEFERPKVIDGDTAHWIRREIGRIKRAAFDPSWVTDIVPCMSFDQVVHESYVLRRKQTNVADFRISHRPHAVKIDTEGNDHPIVRSIIKLPPKMLPLLILYEVKTYKVQVIDEIRHMLTKAGYSTNVPIVRENGHFYFDDVIAILRNP